MSREQEWKTWDKWSSHMGPSKQQLEQHRKEMQELRERRAAAENEKK